MAITRTQIAKQLLAQGGRTGFKKGRDTDFQQRGMSKADYAASTKQQNFSARDDGPNIFDEVALVTGPKTKTKTKTKTKDKDSIFNFVPSFLKARQKGLYNLIPNNPKRELQFLSNLRITNPAKYNTLPQNLKDLIESTDQDFAPSFKDSPKLSFEDFDSLTEFDDGAFAQYAKDRGSPGLSVSGDMSKVGLKSVRRDKFGNPVKDMFGNTLFDYDEPRGDRGDPSILLPQGIMTEAPSITEPEPEEVDMDDRYLAFRADGGRIGFRIGSGEGKDVSGREYGGPPGKGSGSNDRDRRRVEQYKKPPSQTKPDPTVFDKTKALATVPLNFIGSLFGNPFDPKKPIQVINTKAQKDYLDYLASQKEDDTGVLSYDDYGTKFNLSDLKDPIAFSTAMTMGGTGFKKADTGDITYTGGTYDFDGAVPFIDSGGLMGLAYRGGEFLGDKLKPAKLADGGNVVGGEYDFESARQMYGLGKLVKKVGRTVKKIAKSPIGKAALLYAGGTFLGGLKFAGGAGLGSGTFLSNLRSGQGIANLGGFLKGKLLSSATTKPGTSSGGLLNLIRDNPMASIFGASALAGLLTAQQEEEAQELARGEGIDIEAARRSILNAGTSQDFRARRFVAEGGSMKEPVAKKTMPLLDMGGKEMDLREDGGFVPIGRMEKADDVPARLSKNEFVFTADAVRNAGDGDVDKGAEVMYNMMKNLESGGDVSEESQGLEGARRMFQTSQRLEEVL